MERSESAQSEGAQAERPEYSSDGVDLTMIRWMLSLTPAERLQTLQRFVNSVEKIRAQNAGD